MIKTQERFKSLINKKIHNWTVTDTPITIIKKAYYLTCVCECGKKGLVNMHALIKNGSKSCGCKKPVNTEGFKKWAKENGSPNKKPEGVASFNRLYGSYKHTSKIKNLPFNLTKEDFKILTSQNCHYCGAIPKKIRKTGIIENGGYAHNGVDRKNNDIGYIVDNCLPCCSICNYLKRAKGYEEFINLIYKISEHRKNEEKSQP